VKLALVVTQGPLAGRRFRLLQEGIYVFGRDDELPGFLGDDEYLSGQHFEVEVRAGGAILRDVGSRNGTRLNGRRLKPTRFALKPDGDTGLAPDNDGDEILLADGDAVFAGATALAVSLEAGATCSECGAAIPDGEEPEHRWLGGAFLCSACRHDMLERDDDESQRAEQHESHTMSLGTSVGQAPVTAASDVVTCARCGVAFPPGAEPPSGRPLLPVCPSCSSSAGALLHELEAALKADAAPAGLDDLEAALKVLQPRVRADARSGDAPAPVAAPGREFSFAGLSGVSTVARTTAGSVGASLDDFALGAHVERGGPGEVRRATRRGDGAEMIVRLIDAPAANVELGRRFVQAFEPWLGRERRRLTCARAVGCAPGLVFVASDLVAGRTLPRFANVQEQALPLGATVEIGLQVLQALDALHRDGAVHGELRPDCVLVAGKDVDVDLEVHVTEAGVTTTLLSSGLLGREVWRPFLSMLPWMAPELAADPRIATPASDLFAAAALIYHLIAERPPRTLPAVLTDPSRVLRDVPLTPLRWHRTDLPPALEAFLARALSPSPDARFASAREMAEALADTLLDGD